jgi:predicted Fe-Mo cluster-binding NifX family protein
MKIGIATEKENVEGEVSMRAGRAPYYLIFENKKLVKKMKNPFAVGGGGAGFSVAKMLSDEGVKKVVSGSLGGNMKTALEGRGVKSEEFTGSIKEALEKFS